MSNLRSDARHFASTLAADSPGSMYITRLCCQIDDVEERWHKAERDLAAANARIERLREECRKWREWCRTKSKPGCVPLLGYAARKAVDDHNDLDEKQLADAERKAVRR